MNVNLMGYFGMRNIMIMAIHNFSKTFLHILNVLCHIKITVHESVYLVTRYLWNDLPLLIYFFLKAIIAISFIQLFPPRFKSYIISTRFTYHSYRIDLQYFLVLNIHSLTQTTPNNDMDLEWFIEQYECG